MNADVRPIRTAAETGLADAFEAARRSLPGTPAVRALRDAAFAEVMTRGLPSRRVEEWKYTDLRAAMRDAKPLAKAPTAAEIEAARAFVAFDGVDCLRLVFVNGRFAPELSDAPTDASAGVAIAPLAEALAAGGPEAAAFGAAVAPYFNAAVALNTAFTGEGLSVTIAAGVAVARPIHVAHVQVGEAHAAYARVIVSVAAGASVTLIESHAGDGAGHQTNGLVAFDVADGGAATAIKLQDEGLGTLHLATLGVRLGAAATFESLALTAGAQLSRQQIYLTFVGARSRATISGAAFAGARRHLDTTLVVEHAAPGCVSRERFKTALDGAARSVFQGKIAVRPGAQKTDGKMMAQALLLSDEAEADAKPELEIFADDVVCGHGATVGALDDELLFYLMSRGVPKPAAEALLVQAFVGEVIETVAHEGLREALLARAERWLLARD